MSEPAPSSPRPGIRHLMAIPLVISVLAMAGALYLVFLSPAERPASGERLTLRFQSTCAPEAGAVIEARARAIGLGDPVLRTRPDEIELEATLPGLPDDRTAIPALLARPGHLELRVGDTLVATEADINGQPEINLDMKGAPYASLPLMTAASKRFAEAAGPVRLTLDGEVLLDEPGSAPLTEDQIRVTPRGQDAAEKMRRAVDWSIVLGSGPLPCPVVIPLDAG